VLRTVSSEDTKALSGVVLHNLRCLPTKRAWKRAFYRPRLG